MLSYSFLAPLPEECQSRVSEVNQLLHQLSQNSAGITAQSLGLAAKRFRLLFATQQDRLVGMATLVSEPLLSGNIGVIHDVVVDEAARGQHIGRELMDRLECEAKVLLIKSLNLTSAPHRIQANKLYRDLGYELRPTNVYRKIIGG